MEEKKSILIFHVYPQHNLLGSHRVVTFFSEEEANEFKEKGYGEHLYISFNETVLGSKISIVLDLLIERFGDIKTRRFFGELIAKGIENGKTIYHEYQFNKNLSLNISMDIKWEYFQPMSDYLELHLSERELYVLRFGTIAHGLLGTLKLSYDFMFGLALNGISKTCVVLLHRFFSVYKVENLTDRGYIDIIIVIYIYFFHKYYNGSTGKN